MQELFKRVKESEATKSVWRLDFNSTEWKEASKLNHLLFGKPLNKAKKCECIEDLFLLLKSNNINQKINNEMGRQFFLKKGKVIVSYGCDAVTSDSSDAQLIKLLKQIPAHIKNFDKVPDNWKEICGLEEAPRVAINSSKAEEKEVVKAAFKEDVESASAEPLEESENLAQLEIDLLNESNKSLKAMIKNLGGEIPTPSNKANLVSTVIELS